MKRIFALVLALALLPLLTAGKRFIPWQTASGGGGYDSDAQAFFDAVVANGGTISTATKGYVNTFVLAAKANSYWSKLSRINLFCGDQLAAVAVPLKAGGASALDTLTNFVSGDYSESTGLTGNGSSKYLDTGWTPITQATQNDTHIAIYNRSSSSGGTNVSGAEGSSLFLVYVPYSDGSVYSDQYNDSTGRVSGAIGTPYGFLVTSRTASNSHVIYRNGSSVSTSTNSGGTVTAISNSVYIFANHSSGPQSYGSNTFGSYSIGSGLTSGDVSNYNTDLEAFQDSLGRGVQ